MSEAGFHQSLKNNTLKVESLERIAKIFNVPTCMFFGGMSKTEDAEIIHILKGKIYALETQVDGLNNIVAFQKTNDFAYELIKEILENTRISLITNNAEHLVLENEYYKDLDMDITYGAINYLPAAFHIKYSESFKGITKASYEKKQLALNTFSIEALFTNKNVLKAISHINKNAPREIDFYEMNRKYGYYIPEDRQRNAVKIGFHIEDLKRKQY
tara:strand:+ start:1603 stop:2247 length:645 start_codon:yes stop_codon:yes gene_type:complete